MLSRRPFPVFPENLFVYSTVAPKCHVVMMMDALLTLLNVASVGLLVSAVMCRLSRTYKFYFKSSTLYLIYFLTSLGRLHLL